jgi:type IV pilus assembly protein PilM
MASTVVGIDIGSVAIRAVEVRDAEKARPTVVRFADIPLPEGAVARGEVIEQRTVASSLKRLWSTGGFGSKRAVIGMGNQRVLARDLTLPRMSITRIRESLPYQVQDHLPVPVEEALLDFYPVSESMSESGPVVNGLLVAAIKEAVLGNVRAVELAGLTTSGVDLVPFALSRLLLGTSASGAAGVVTEAAVEIGATATTVVISTLGVPQFLRIIPSGGEDATEALRLRLELERDQAEQLKRRIGLTTRVEDPELEPAMHIINELTSDLLGSIRNTVAYFAHTRPDAPIQRLQLCGGGASLRGLPDALAELTRLPVVPVDILSTVSTARSVDAAVLHARQAEFAVALGLAVGASDGRSPGRKAA